MTSSVDVLVQDLYFPEALRWHEGHLWFSDVFGGDVCRVGSSGVEVVAHLPESISGLGWLPDGSTLVVSCGPRKLLRIARDGLISDYADLSDYLNFDANDMIVDEKGRAYVGNYGFDVSAGADPIPTNLIRVNLDRTVVTEQPALVFPNGAALVDGGRGLVVAETFADRLSYLRVAEDGHLHDARILARLPAGAGPDGITADASGGVWVACAFGSAVIRLTPDGQISDRIEFPGMGVYCCALGGSDGRTLYVAIASLDESLAERERTGSIVSVQVSVPTDQVIR
jgi:sugar lactone lactonase YvrE